MPTLHFDFQYGIVQSCLWGEDGVIDPAVLPPDLRDRMAFLCGAFQESLNLDTAEYTWSPEDWHDFKSATDDLLTVLRQVLAGQAEIIDARFFNDLL